MRNNYRNNNDVYFAHLEGDDFVNAVRNKIDLFYDDVKNMYLRDLIERSYRCYYGADLSQNSPLFESSKLTTKGRSNEIVDLKLNHHRNLIKHTKQLVTNQKPALGCRASNSDYKSQAQTVLGVGLVDYYMREKSVGSVLSQAVESCLVEAEGWVHAPWNPGAGEKYDLDESGKPIFEGDIEFSVHSLLDVARDYSLSHNANHSWLCVREKKNRWDLIASHPEYKDEIIAANAEDLTDYEVDAFQVRRTSDELIDVWTFYHDKTAAVPDGRLAIICGDALLFDGKNPYEKIPLFRLVADKILKTPYGYSPAMDSIGGQEALNILTSTIMTNQATFGVNSVWTRRGDPIDVTQLSEGLKHFESDTMPQAVQLTATPAEIFNFRKTIIGELETLHGISSTVRGNPENNLKSGSALALVVSQSIQFASLLENSYNALMEDVGTAIITHLRTFSRTPRVAKIVGNFNRPFMKEFNADDLSQINRVVVEQQSALSKTISGRVEMATQLLQNGFIENAKQYITVLQTGNLDPAIEGAQSMLLNIRAENEDMQNGLDVSVIATEHHEMHIKEHRTILENPEAKRNPELVTRVLSHIQGHINTWRTTDPAILMVTGQNPPPQSPNNLPAPQAPSQGIDPSAMTNAPSLPDEEPNMPNMPNLPPNAPPETQQAFDTIDQPLPQ